jgi:hypothetical protein
MFKINYKLLICALISTSSLLGIIFLQKKSLSNNLSTQKNINYQQQEQQLKAEANFLKKMPSLGFNNLIADYTFLKYIQYFGDTEARDKIGYSGITDYFETVIQKDPKFIRAHLSLSATNSIFAGNPEKTVALLEQATQSLDPNMRDYAFMIFAYKAVDEIIFLGDLDAAQKSYLKAAQWAEIRGDKIGIHVAPLYRATVNFLATNPDSTSTQVSGWYMVLKQNNDPQVQEYAKQKIIELGGEITININGEIIVKPPKKDV